MITRFAPSPTGKIHIGNARTALVCFLYARKHNGKFLLRIDDTDQSRCKQSYTEDLKHCLGWLGIDYDVCFHQSDNIDRYTEVLNQLIDSGWVYPCYETPEELSLKRKIQLKHGKPPVYDRSALQMTESQLKNYLAEGRKPHFRFKLRNNNVISWNDLVKGKLDIGLASLSDPILVRTDGSYTYMLPSTVDDLDYGVTDVIRGEDHLTNTAVQIDMIYAIDSSRSMRFAHIGLLRDKSGKFSKRINSLAVSEVISEGLEPMALINYLAKTVDCSKNLAKDLDSIVATYSINSFSSANSIFDFDTLLQVNSKVVRMMNFSQVKDRLPMISNDFWEAICRNIKTVEEAKRWWSVCKEEIQTECADKELLSVAADLIEEESWDDGVWDRWMLKLKEKTNLRGRTLFLPLRLALTASDDGPELAKMIPLIAKDKVIKRLRFNKG